MFTALHHFVFCSQAQVDFSDAELLLLARRVYAHSQDQPVTGVLLYRAGQFMGVFEGPAAVVTDMAQRVHLDARHRNMLTLAAGPIACRSFRGWHMTFSLSQPELEAERPAGCFDLRYPAQLTALAPGLNSYLLDIMREFADVAVLPEVAVYQAVKAPATRIIERPDLQSGSFFLAHRA